MPPRRGATLRVPPYRFDQTPSLVVGGNSPIRYRPPVAAEGTAAGPMGGASPFLYTAGTVTAFDGNTPVSGWGDTYQDDFTAFYPFNIGRPNFVTRQPRCVVVLTPAFPTGLVADVVAAALGPCQEARAALLVSTVTRFLGGCPFLTAWAPVSALWSGAAFDPTITTNHVPPEAWLAGDVLVIFCGESFYSMAEVYYNLSPETGFITTPLVNVGREMFGRMLPRCNRFKGVYFHGPTPPPEPPFAGIESFVPIASAWEAIAGGLPWTRTQVASAFAPLVAAEIAAFWA